MTTANMISINADTTLYTATAEFAGYTLLESFLGDMSASDFVAAGDSEDSDLNSLLTIAQDYIDDSAVFTDEKEAESNLENHKEEGGLRALKIESFTVRGLLAEIKGMAADEAKYRNDD